VQSAGQTLAVSADGYLLPGVSTGGAKLPPVEGREQAGRLDPEGTAQVAIIGAAPEELRESIASASWDEDHGGVVVDLEGAPELRFGDGELAEQKWRAVAAVLASPDPGTPAYVDVSVPDRTVTGG